MCVWLNSYYDQGSYREKLLKFVQQFSRPPEKVWKIEIKSGKAAKVLEFFSKLQQVLQYTLAAHSEKSFGPAFLKVCIDHDTYLITLSVGKKNVGKKSEKSLQSLHGLGWMQSLFVCCWFRLSFAPKGFSPGYFGFPVSSKPTFPNSNLTRNQVKEEPLFGCATSI